jgi:thiamine kinase-like enzyme
MFESLQSFLNCKKEDILVTVLSSAKDINVTYKIEYKNKLYALRKCKEEYYNFLREVSYSFKNISPSVLYTNDNDYIIINEWINNEGEYKVEDIVNSIKEIQMIKDIPYNSFYNNLLQCSNWINKDCFTYHKRWYDLYFKINSFLRKELKVVVCHNDLHNENILYNSREIKIIDLELVSYNHMYVDLAQQSSYFDKELLLKEYHTNEEYDIRLFELAIIEYFLYYSFMVRNLNNFTKYYDIPKDIKRFNDFDVNSLNLLNDYDNFIASLVMGFEGEELIKEFNRNHKDFFIFE